MVKKINECIDNLQKSLDGPLTKLDYIVPLCSQDKIPFEVYATNLKSIEKYNNLKTELESITNAPWSLNVIASMAVANLNGVNSNEYILCLTKGNK